MKKRKRNIPTIPTGSMADIAFLLLIFFLVSTHIKNPKGIQVLLPPYLPTPPQEMDEDKVLTIRLNKDNLISLEEQVVLIDQVAEKIKMHIKVRLAQDEQPIISLVTDTAAHYHSYISVYDEIRSAFSDLREEAAQRKYVKSYEQLDRSSRLAINREVPMIISEADYF